MLTPQKILHTVTVDMFEFLCDVEEYTGVTVGETPPYVCGISVSATERTDTFTLTRHTPELLRVAGSASEWASFAAYVASTVVTEGVAYGYIGFILGTELDSTTLVGLLFSRDGAVLDGCRLDIQEESPAPVPIPTAQLTSHFPFLLFGVHHDASLSH